MIEMQFFRVGALPETLTANSLYLVRNAVSGALEITATGVDGTPTHGLTSQDVLTLIQQNVPETSLAAEKLATARKIQITGDAAWEVSFDGEGDVAGVMTLAASGVAAGEYAVVTVNEKGIVTAARALAPTDLPAEITSDTTGNAATATMLAAPVTINGVDFDGSAPIVINAEDSVARIAVTEKGAANGVATLDAAGLIPTSQLPGFVDDVLEFAAYEDLPGEANNPDAVGEKGKIYVVAGDASTEVYRWSGSTYIEIPSGVGTADAAVKLATARSLIITGDANWQVSFDGTEDVTAALTLSETGIAAGTYAGITFGADGRATSARPLEEADMPMLTHAKVESAQSVLVTGDW